MIRYAFALLAAMGTFAAAAAFQDAPAATTPHAVAAHETVIVKNSAFPVIGPVDWVQCTTDDCSDRPNE